MPPCIASRDINSFVTEVELEIVRTNGLIRRDIFAKPPNDVPAGASNRLSGSHLEHGRARGRQTAGTLVARGPRRPLARQPGGSPAAPQRSADDLGRLGVTTTWQSGPAPKYRLAAVSFVIAAALWFAGPPPV